MIVPSAVLLLLLIGSIIIKRYRTTPTTLSTVLAALIWFVSIAVIASVIAGIHVAASMLPNLGGYVRVSPGAGFWLAIAGSALAIRWAKHTIMPTKLLMIAELTLLSLGLYLAWKTGAFERFSPYLELRVQGKRFISELIRHLKLSISSFTCALVIGVMGAILLYRGRRIGAVLGRAAGVIQNIPSLALFGLLLPIMAVVANTFPALRTIGISGIGFAPAFLALVAYALLPIMLAGAAGLRMVDSGAKDAARGMGMSPRQILFRVELPLALPAITSGARTALVQTIGTTTVAALIGAGGMGYFVFQGVGQAAMDMVIIGVVPIVVLSIAADKLMGALERRLARKRGDAWP